MWETKTVLACLSIFLLLATSFCIYQVHTKKKAEHHSEVKNQIPCGIVYKKYRLNGGECYYLVDEDIVGCIFTTYGGKG